MMKTGRFFPKALNIILICVSLVHLSGCGQITLVYPEGSGRKVEAIPEEETTEEYKPTYMDQIGEAVFPDAYTGETGAENEEYDVESEENSGGIDGLKFFTDEDLSVAYNSNRSEFAYSQLTVEYQKIYNQMYLALMTMSSNVGIDCYDEETINRLFTCVMMDHPEIFWVSGYVYTRYTRGENMEAMGFKGTYTMDAQTVSVRQAAIGNYVSACLYNMPSGDDYSKIRYIYEYIIKNTVYDTSAVDNQNICSVFINGRSVCQGYAKATQYLCDRAGITCTLVTGHTTQDGNHAWNLVLSDGEYYYVDTTWGDANYRSDSGDESSIPSISYDYLCVPAYELFKTHTPETPVALPDCYSMSDNYYVREGAYFTYPDEAGLQALFDDAYQKGMEFVTVKASDDVSYSSIRAYLLDSQNVFRILGDRKSGNTISFWENPESYTMSFKLT